MVQTFIYTTQLEGLGIFLIWTIANMRLSAAKARTKVHIEKRLGNRGRIVHT